MGTSELLSVPFALFAENTANNDDADADPTNEFQTFTQNGLEVSLSQGGGTINVADNDNNYSNELQTLTKEGNVVSLSQNGGSFVDEVDDADADPVNEIQYLSKTQNTLSLSGGGQVLVGVLSYSQTEIDALTPYNGLTVHNTTTNCINYYYVNNWFEACGTCTPQPTQAAAGDNQNFTNNTTAATLAANTPTHGTGLWTVQTGEGGSFDDATNPSTTFTGQPCTSYTLNWTITNTCGASADNVSVTFNHLPSTPDAGPDQIGIGGNTTTLAGNTPVEGTGLWTVVTGEGGSFGDPTSPTSTFTGVPTTDYTLSWTISTPCASSSDNVNIRFWSCGLPITDARDSKTYTTIQIGTQCWMAQNLNVGNRIAGTANPANNTTIEKYCYSNSDAQCDVYGGLYQWNEMMNYSTTPGVQGICPDGWHLPTDAEWCTLTTYLDATVNCSTTQWSGTNAGGKMKETGTTHWTSPNTGATNSSGFTALPGGLRLTDGSFVIVSNYGRWWSSLQYDASNALSRYLGYESASVCRGIDGKSAGYSVRCLKDN
jgi:uncharacterized protein (TIGR02145 family)